MTDSRSVFTAIFKADLG